MAIDIASWSLAGVAAFAGALVSHQAGFAFSAVAPGRVAPCCRGAADPGTPPDLRGRSPLNLRAEQLRAQLRQHHRAALASRGRRRFRGLGHHGVARRNYRSAAIGLDPRRDFQRHCLRQHQQDLTIEVALFCTNRLII
jgi:hypothetical protein